MNTIAMKTLLLPDRPRPVVWLLAGLLLLPLSGLGQRLQVVRAAALAGSVADLTWNSAVDAVGYEVYRLFPEQEAFVRVAATAGAADTHCTDSLHRVFCADTVSYYVCATLTDSSRIESDTVGILFRDDQPTAGCRLHLCTVDTLLRQVRLTWHPSRDTDVLGYYLCRGGMNGPCLDYDTVWGRTDTTYLCPDTLDPAGGGEQHRFRILAFDSCFQASPLTPFYHYLTLNIHRFDCSRRLLADWNGYVNMPDSVGEYVFCYRLEGDTLVRTHRAAAAGQRQFDTMVADVAVGSVYAYVYAENSSRTLRAYSLPQTYRFDYGDTADYVRIAEGVYDSTLLAVRLTIEIDPSFGGRSLSLYRRRAEDTAFALLAELDRSGELWQSLVYLDSAVGQRAAGFVYLVGVKDLCGQREKYSDTVRVDIPELPDPGAWVPNAMVAGHPACGRFCPRFVSPLAGGYSLEIYNRRGERLFHTTDIEACWDGTADGRLQPEGAYVYHIRCRHADGSIKHYTGTITLIR